MKGNRLFSVIYNGAFEFNESRIKISIECAGRLCSHVHFLFILDNKEHFASFVSPHTLFTKSITSC